MRETFSRGNLGAEVNGNRWLKLERPDTVQLVPAPSGQRPYDSPGAGPTAEGTEGVTVQLPEEMNREATPDLSTNCPVCGHSYEWGQGVLALAGLSFGTHAVVPSPAAAGRDPGNMIVLGHRACVLPRLLTLLADFQPEYRFVKASGPSPLLIRYPRSAIMTSPDHAAFSRRALTVLGGAVKRGILGKSTREYVQQLKASDEYWNQVIAAQRGWSRKPHPDA